MNIYLKIDSILEQKNKRFEDRYELVQTPLGCNIVPRLGFDLETLNGGISKVVYLKQSDFNCEPERPTSLIEGGLVSADKCRGGLFLTKGIVFIKEGQENTPDYLKRADL